MPLEYRIGRQAEVVRDIGLNILVSDPSFDTFMDDWVSLMYNGTRGEVLEVKEDSVLVCFNGLLPEGRKKLLCFWRDQERYSINTSLIRPVTPLLPPYKGKYDNLLGQDGYIVARFTGQPDAFLDYPSEEDARLLDIVWPPEELP